MGVVATCLKKVYIENQQVIKSYILRDVTGIVKEVPHDDLRDAMKLNLIHVNNLKLTQDNKIISVVPQSVSTIKSTEQKIKESNKDSLQDKSTDIFKQSPKNEPSNNLSIKERLYGIDLVAPDKPSYELALYKQLWKLMYLCMTDPSDIALSVKDINAIVKGLTNTKYIKSDRDRFADAIKKKYPNISNYILAITLAYATTLNKHIAYAIQQADNIKTTIKQILTSVKYQEAIDIIEESERFSDYYTVYTIGYAAANLYIRGYMQDTQIPDKFLLYGSSCDIFDYHVGIALDLYSIIQPLLHAQPSDIFKNHQVSMLHKSKPNPIMERDIGSGRRDLRLVYSTYSLTHLQSDIIRYSAYLNPKGKINYSGVNYTLNKLFKQQELVEEPFALIKKAPHSANLDSSDEAEKLLNSKLFPAHKLFSYNGSLNSFSHSFFRVYPEDNLKDIFDRYIEDLSKCTNTIQVSFYNMLKLFKYWADTFVKDGYKALNQMYPYMCIYCNNPQLTISSNKFGNGGIKLGTNQLMSDIDFLAKYTDALKKVGQRDGGIYINTNKTKPIGVVVYGVLDFCTYNKALGEMGHYIKFHNPFETSERSVFDMSDQEDSNDCLMRHKKSKYSNRYVQVQPLEVNQTAKYQTQKHNSFELDVQSEALQIYELQPGEMIKLQVYEELLTSLLPENRGILGKNQVYKSQSTHSDIPISTYTLRIESKNRLKYSEALNFVLNSASALDYPLDNCNIKFSNTDFLKYIYLCLNSLKFKDIEGIEFRDINSILRQGLPILDSLQIIDSGIYTNAPIGIPTTEIIKTSQIDPTKPSTEKVYFTSSTNSVVQSILNEIPKYSGVSDAKEIMGQVVRYPNQHYGWNKNTSKNPNTIDFNTLSPLQRSRIKQLLYLSQISQSLGYWEQISSNRQLRNRSTSVDASDIQSQVSPKHPETMEIDKLITLMQKQRSSKDLEIEYKKLGDLRHVYNTWINLGRYIGCLRDIQDILDEHLKQLKDLYVSSYSTIQSSHFPYMIFKKHDYLAKYPKVTIEILSNLLK